MSPKSANRRRFQYGLRALFFVVTLISLWLGWNVHVVEQRRAAMALFASEGWDLDTSDERADVELSWLRRRLGDHVVRGISTTGLSPSQDLTRARASLPEAKLYIVGPDCATVVAADRELELLRFDPVWRALLMSPTDSEPSDDARGALFLDLLPPESAADRAGDAESHAEPTPER